MIDFPTLALASLVLVIAHILRAARWSLLLPDGSIVPRFAYLLGLAVGYLLNTFVPLRIGELFRIGIASRSTSHRFALVAATVVVERITDLIIVAAIFVAALGLADGAGLSILDPLTLVLAAVIGLGVGALIPRSVLLRKVLWSIAGLFNARISTGFADFFWVYSELVESRAILKFRYLGMTVAMWSAYFISYDIFAEAIGLGGLSATVAILGDPLGAQVESFGLTAAGAAGRLARGYLFYSAVPLVIIGTIGILRHRQNMRRMIIKVRNAGHTDEIAFAGRDHFMTPDVYNHFLIDQFRGEDRLATSFWREALGDCVMHRFYNGGSDAITALVEVDEHLSIRKFAIGSAGDKLKGQADWLRAYKGGALPLVTVASERKTDDVYIYDMPMVVPSNDFFDVIHTRDGEMASEMLVKVLDRIEAFHAENPCPDADDATVDAYLDQKARKNAETILEFIRSEFRGDTLEINGRRYRLADFEKLTDMDWLRRQVTSRKVAVIHGDLTIENVIVAPQYPDGFYIIDPNPENVFNSPLIDWAKLMQSLHLGYETLNRAMHCTIEGDNTIVVHSMRSHAYSDLYETLLAEFERRHGTEALQEMFFHEIVNYLRLTTYKIRQNRIRGIGFFACTMVILGEYLNRWD